MARTLSMFLACLETRQALIQERITAARKVSNLSQNEAAQLLGIHRPSLSLIESGDQRLTVEMILTMADAYDFLPAWLLGCDCDSVNPWLPPERGNLSILGASPIPLPPVD